MMTKAVWRLKPEPGLEVEFVALGDIDEAQIIALMNNERVVRLLPLLNGAFSSQHCRAFLAAKKQMWEQYGFGPWAIVIRGEFAGWGGLQPEQGEADFALVLHPGFWGWGRAIFELVKDYAFNQMALDSMTILFPPTRANARAISRIGFAEDGQTTVNGECFTRYRLKKR